MAGKARFIVNNDDIKIGDNIFALLADDAVRTFAGHGDWLGKLTEVQMRHVTEQVLCLIAARHWRIHRDYPLCTECREPVMHRAAEARNRAETEGRELAGRIAETFRAQIEESIP